MTASMIIYISLYPQSGLDCCTFTDIIISMPSLLFSHTHMICTYPSTESRFDLFGTWNGGVDQERWLSGPTVDPPSKSQIYRAKILTVLISRYICIGRERNLLFGFDMIDAKMVEAADSTLHLVEVPPMGRISISSIAALRYMEVPGPRAVTGLKLNGYKLLQFELAFDIKFAE